MDSPTTCARDAQVPHRRGDVGNRVLLPVQRRVVRHVGGRVAARRVGHATVLAREEADLLFPFTVVRTELVDEDDRKSGARLLVVQARAFGLGVGHGVWSSLIPPG
jgi:hypothetical protein